MPWDPRWAKAVLIALKHEQLNVATVLTCFCDMYQSLGSMLHSM
jgi:hypothetical protein